MVEHDPVEPYRRSQRVHGDDFRVTLWASPRSQRARFRVITQMAFLADKRLLDAGCSRGDLAAYLLERQIPFRGYVGIDAVTEVIDYAKARRLPGCEFLAGDLLTNPALFRTGDPQVICVSGTLNTMSDAQVRAFLDHAWEATAESLVFNFLSDRCGPGAVPQTPPARRLDTLALIQWALARTDHVLFRQDYFKHGHDATILMKKKT